MASERLDPYNQACRVTNPRPTRKGSPVKDIDTLKVADIIRRVAAAEVMPRFRNLQQTDIREKNPGDLVTVADEGSEKMLSQLLRDFLPGSVVVGEEAVSKDRAVLDKLKGDKPVWIIDPIDGTSNFASGLPAFGMLLALVQGGVTYYGWAFDPPGKRMAIGQKGAGTFLDGKRVTITCAAGEMKQMVGQADGRPAADFDLLRPSFRELVKQRCCLHDYMKFFTGAADFVIHDWSITPWDHAAVVMLAQEAGAYVAVDNGIAYDPTQYRPAFLLAAPSQDWWTKLHAVIYPALHPA